MFYRYCLLLILLATSSNSLSQTYTFGVVPQQSAKKLAQIWTPILAHISAETGHQLQFQTAKNIPTFEKRLADGAYDLAYMNPYHYTVFHKSPGYKAFARRDQQKISGIIVVHKDSSYKYLSDLDGMKLAFPSPAAFAASILTRSQLEMDNINFTPNYVSSHDSVYLTVSKNIFAAGGGVVRTYNNTDPKVKKNLRILWKTEAYTPHAFAAHPKTPENVIKDIQKSMQNLSKSEKGKALLESVKFKHGIVSAKDNDWDDVRALKIELLSDL